jgi:hypothetical protein
MPKSSLTHSQTHACIMPTKMYTQLVLFLRSSCLSQCFRDQTIIPNRVHAPRLHYDDPFEMGQRGLVEVEMVFLALLALLAISFAWV